MIINRFIPFRGFTAVNLFGLIFVRKGMRFTVIDLFYGLEWFVRFIAQRDILRAYLSISFEREAYAHQRDEDYLRHRRPYAWLHYLRRPTQKGQGTSK